ncbi:M23 family metallopeptidase [bacterium]|nr:M23 family metallopeptidase [bacterium]
MVYSSAYNSAYGNVIKIKFQYQGEILYAVYAHMSERLVEAGDIVQAGDIIGKTGNSGNVF